MLCDELRKDQKTRGHNGRNRSRQTMLERAYPLRIVVPLYLNL